jgi:hypothetical protein
VPAARRWGAEPAHTRRLSARNDKELAKGPARPAAAQGVDRALDGTDAGVVGDTPLRMPTGTPVPSDQVRSGLARVSRATEASTLGASGSPTTRQ